MAGAHDGLLDEHRRVAKRAVGFAHGGLEGLAQVFGLVDAPHSATTAARDGLGEHREADLVGPRDQHLDVGRCRSRLEHRDARRDGVLLGRDLVAGHLEHVLARADEGDPVGCGRGSEVGVLGQEPVARVDRVGARLLRHADDLVDIEVGPHGVTLLADLVRLVGLQPVQGVAILVRVDRHRLSAELVRGAESPDRNFATVRHEDFAEHAVLSGRLRQWR